MEDRALKKEILEFFRSNLLTVISTIDIGGKKPESAVIAFAETDNLEVIFGTSIASRKYANLQKNPRASFVIGWSMELGSVQYEGTAKKLSKEESLPYATLMAQKNPRSAKFMEREDQRYFLVKPEWIRFTDKKSDKILEINF